MTLPFLGSVFFCVQKNQKVKKSEKSENKGKKPYKPFRDAVFREKK